MGIFPGRLKLAPSSRRSKKKLSLIFFSIFLLLVVYEYSIHFKPFVVYIYALAYIAEQERSRDRYILQNVNVKSVSQNCLWLNFPASWRMASLSELSLSSAKPYIAFVSFPGVQWPILSKGILGHDMVPSMVHFCVC